MRSFRRLIPGLLLVSLAGVGWGIVEKRLGNVQEIENRIKE